jgi:tetratricopeptide (TPR) repeat protein
MRGVAAAVMGLSAGACAQEPPTALPGLPVNTAQQTPGPLPASSPTPDETAPPEQTAQRITLNAGDLPHVTLTADILYKVLAAEIAVQRGALLPAANTTLALARETADPRLAQRAVELYAAIGDVQGALNAAEVWQANAPDDQDAIATRLALSAAAGKTAGLADALADKIRSSANKREALLRTIDVLRRMPDRAQALRLLEITIDKSNVKGTLAAYIALADVAQAAGENERALSEAQKALRLVPDSEDAAMRVLEYGAAVDPQEAIDRARTFARAYPAARQLRLMLAGQLSEQGDTQGALDELALMSSQYPEDFDLLFVRAQLAYQDGQIDLANQMLEQYVQVQTQRQDAIAAGASDATAALADAYSLLARIAQEQGQADEAILWLGRIQDPTARYSARLRQATIRADQGRVDEAVAMIDAAGPIDQDEKLIGVLTMAQILRSAQRYDQAIERLAQADAEIVDSIEIKYELGMLLERRQRFEEMETYLREVIELDPGYAHAYNALGYSLADRDLRLDEAYDLIYRAHQILPEDPYILDSLGWVTFKQGDNEQALTYLRQAYEIEPQAEIAAHLGEVLWRMGRQDDARKVWRDGANLDESNLILQKTMQRFGVAL